MPVDVKKPLQGSTHLHVCVACVVCDRSDLKSVPVCHAATSGARLVITSKLSVSRRTGQLRPSSAPQRSL